MDTCYDNRDRFNDGLDQNMFTDTLERTAGTPPINKLYGVPQGSILGPPLVHLYASSWSVNIKSSFTVKLMTNTAPHCKLSVCFYHLRNAAKVTSLIQPTKPKSEFNPRPSVHLKRSRKYVKRSESGDTLKTVTR